MSESDERKKQSELDCLNEVIRIGKSQYGQSRKIIGLLDGEPVIRDIEERPDFVRLAPAKKPGEKDIVLGIEHFRVDQQSKRRKNGKIISAREAIKREADELTRAVDEKKLFFGQDQLDTMMTNLANHVMDAYSGATYSMFLDSISDKLQHHLSQVDSYRKNLFSLAVGRDVRLAFLIDISTVFNRLYFHDSSGTHRNDSGLMPFFEDIIQRFERIDSDKVDYLIFFLHSPNSASKKVIALKTSGIRKQLKVRHINIYEYDGADYFLPEGDSFFSDPQLEMSMKKIDDHTVKKHTGGGLSVIAAQCYRKFVLDALKKEKELKQRGIVNYCTDKGIEATRDLFDGYIKWIPHNGTFCPAFVSMPNEEYEKRKAFVDEKYFPNSFIRGGMNNGN